jgi:hypothetical protein
MVMAASFALEPTREEGTAHAQKWYLAQTKEW